MKRIFLILALVCSVCLQASAQSADSKSPDRAYQDLLLREQNIRNEINHLTSMLPTLKGGKAKKAAKRLDELVAMEEGIQRTKLYFPESVRTQQPKQSVDDAAREQVHSMIAEKVVARGGTMDDEEEPEYQPEHQIYWSVALMISATSDASKVKGFDDLQVENLGGKFVFFTGRYDTKSEAESACKQIKRKGRYTNAFVIQRDN